ncbi:hypothetical protein GCM10022247_28420 [Allokutzneria multivorans]|uniref:Exonuclease domain-containing protein n=1 Tax=Allokutzneria multivorans TaxID=1142134 RepID=A0ABP7S1Q9_9PSEU
MLDFVALDVETANARRGSICAIGLVVVENGSIAQRYSWLCRPPESIGHFDGFNVGLHGIRPEMVAGEPRFSERLDHALAIIGDRPVIMHNAGFDTCALRQACDAEGTSWPTLRYGCTLVWARRELDLVSYRLPFVAEALGVPLESHHDAAEDAEACARIFLAMADKRGSATVEEFGTTVGARLGELRSDSWRGCVSGSSQGLVAPIVVTDAAVDHPLHGQVIVFTGALSRRRQDAWDAVARLGATPEPGVTKRTTRLVIGGGFTGDSQDEFMTGKAAKALKLRQKGQPIEVLTEFEFEWLLRMAS